MKKSILVFLFFFVVVLHSSLFAQNHLIVVADPMCSWCYGFSKELDILRKDYTVELKMGGLRTESVGLAGIEQKQFLKSHWKEIAKRTKMVFKDSILGEHTNLDLCTEPANRAVVCIQQLRPEISIDFYKAVQKAFFQYNKSMQSIQTYLEIAQEFHIDTSFFKQSFLSPEIMQKTKKEIEETEAWGVDSFPTFFVKDRSHRIFVFEGYLNAKQLKRRIKKKKTM